MACAIAHSGVGSHGHVGRGGEGGAGKRHGKGASRREAPQKQQLKDWQLRFKLELTKRRAREDVLELAEDEDALKTSVAVDLDAVKKPLRSLALRQRPKGSEAKPVNIEAKQEDLKEERRGATPTPPVKVL